MYVIKLGEGGGWLLNSEWILVRRGGGGQGYATLILAVDNNNLVLLSISPPLLEAVSPSSCT